MNIFIDDTLLGLYFVYFTIVSSLKLTIVVIRLRMSTVRSIN